MGVADARAQRAWSTRKLATAGAVLIVITCTHRHRRSSMSRCVPSLGLALRRHGLDARTLERMSE